MANEDDTVYVSFNGEIYNHQRLRATLDHHRFQTRTDTEVIVIDIRETVSVGPTIGALEQLIRGLVPPSHRSAIKGAVEWLQ